MVWYTASVVLAGVNDRAKVTLTGLKQKRLVRVIVAVQDITLASRQMSLTLRDCNLFRVRTPASETLAGAGGDPDEGLIKTQGSFDLRFAAAVKLADDPYIDAAADLADTRVIVAVETDEPYNDAQAF